MELLFPVREWFFSNHRTVKMAVQIVGGSVILGIEAGRMYKQTLQELGKSGVRIVSESNARIRENIGHARDVISQTRESLVQKTGFLRDYVSDKVRERSEGIERPHIPDISVTLVDFMTKTVGPWLTKAMQAFANYYDTMYRAATSAAATATGRHGRRNGRDSGNGGGGGLGATAGQTSSPSSATLPTRRVAAASASPRQQVTESRQQTGGTNIMVTVGKAGGQASLPLGQQAEEQKIR